MRPAGPGGGLDPPDGRDPQPIMAKHARMKRRRVARRAGLVLAGAVVPLGWLAMGPAQAATRAPDSGSHSGNAQVADAAEAWYAASPIDTCSSPLGCPPAQAPS